MKSLGHLVPWGSIFFVMVASAQESPYSLAERLISLRGQVDELQSELAIRRAEHKNRMVYLSTQLADLESNRDREELRVSQLRENLDGLRREISEGGANSEALLPLALNLIGSLRNQIADGFPFKTNERLTELDELETQLSNGVVSAQRGINRLWAFIEDEIRISRENAIYSQSVTIDGNNVLVDIAKLGSVMMFIRTRKLEYGRAVPDDRGWHFEILKSASEQKQVGRLFDSLRKQIRQGYFELPVAMPPRMGGQS